MDSRTEALLGPELVVTTRGSDGCTAVGPSGLMVERGGQPVDVVDTIGAGDAFQSGLLSGIADLDALAPGRVARLSEEEVASLLDRAVTISAMTCEREGADPPTRPEYDDRRKAAAAG